MLRLQEQYKDQNIPVTELVAAEEQTRVIWQKIAESHKNWSSNPTHNTFANIKAHFNTLKP